MAAMTPTSVAEQRRTAGAGAGADSTALLKYEGRTSLLGRRIRAQSTPAPGPPPRGYLLTRLPCSSTPHKVLIEQAPLLGGAGRAVRRGPKRRAERSRRLTRDKKISMREHEGKPEGCVQAAGDIASLANTEMSFFLVSSAATAAAVAPHEGLCLWC